MLDKLQQALDQGRQHDSNTAFALVEMLTTVSKPELLTPEADPSQICTPQDLERPAEVHEKLLSVESGVSRIMQGESVDKLQTSSEGASTLTSIPTDCEAEKTTIVGLEESSQIVETTLKNCCARLNSVDAKLEVENVSDDPGVQMREKLDPELQSGTADDMDTPVELSDKLDDVLRCEGDRLRPLPMEVEGLGHFNDAVVFAKIVEGAAVHRLANISGLLWFCLFVSLLVCLLLSA